mgnify:CR=1 FL=1
MADEQARLANTAISYLRAATNVTHLTVSRTSWSRPSMRAVSGQHDCGS